MGILLISSFDSTTVWLHPLEFNETLREKATRVLHAVLEEAPHKTAAVLTTHLTNHPSKTSKILLVKKERTHKRYSSMDSYAYGSSNTGALGNAEYPFIIFTKLSLLLCICYLLYFSKTKDSLSDYQHETNKTSWRNKNEFIGDVLPWTRTQECASVG